MKDGSKAPGLHISSLLKEFAVKVGKINIIRQAVATLDSEDESKHDSKSETESESESKSDTKVESERKVKNESGSKRESSMKLLDQIFSITSFFMYQL